MATTWDLKIMMIGMIANGLINSGALGQFPPALEELQGVAVQAAIISLYSSVGIFGKILIIPGGFSIDRCGRIKDKTWWEEENIKILSNEELNKFDNINIILSHSLPFKKLPKGLYEMFKPEDDLYNYKISFDFTEVGNIESNEDMNRFGFLDIGEEWWI